MFRKVLGDNRTYHSERYHKARKPAVGAPPASGKRKSTITNQTVRGMLKESFKTDTTYRSKAELEQFVTQINQVA